MKKLFTFCAWAIFGTSVAFAQITSAEMPVVGSSITYREINKNGFDVYQTMNGLNQVWDYRAALLKSDTVVLSYVNADTTAITDSFASATIAEAISGASGYMFYRSDATGFYRTGFYDASQGITMPYNNELKMYTLPFDFSSVMTDDYTCTNGWIVSGGTPMPATITDGTFSAEATGKGKLRLPAGTYNDVFRVYYEESFTIAINMMGMTMNMAKIEEYGYEYWQAGEVKPILVYVNTTTSDLVQGGSSNTTTVRFNKNAPIDEANPVSVEEMENVISFNAIGSNVYMIDAAEKMVNAQISVYDLLGNLVFTSTIENNTDKYSFSMNAASSGVYVVKVQGNNTNFSRKFNVE